MKITLSTSQAARILCDDKNSNWRWDGAFALVEYLQEFEADAGEEMEFDPIAIRCDWSQHHSLEEWASDYGFDPGMTTEEIRDYIQSKGQIIEFEGGVIVSSF